jgi:hypothetical protein
MLLKRQYQQPTGADQRQQPDSGEEIFEEAQHGD